MKDNHSGTRFRFNLWPLTVLTISLSICASAYGAALVGELDQSHDNTPGSSTAGAGPTFGQTFTVGIDGTLSGVSLKVRCSPLGNGSTTATVQVLATENGIPDPSQVLATRVIEVPENFVVGNPNQDNPYVPVDILSDNVQVNAGDVLAVVLSASEPFPQVTWASGFEVDGSATYVGGDSGYFNQISGDWMWFSSPTFGERDLGFQTFVIPPGVTAGDIDVSPNGIDFGLVNAFDATSQIVTVQNLGELDLTLNSISLSGDTSFSVSTAPSVLMSGEVLDIFVEFRPTSIGTKTGVLQIVSNDPDEPMTLIELIGDGVMAEPEEQSTILESSVDDSILDGTLVGVTSGNGNSSSGGGRLGAFSNMIEAASDLVDAGLTEDACGQLQSSLRRVDGDPRPPDFVSGESAELIRAQIEFLLESLGCE